MFKVMLALPASVSHLGNRTIAMCACCLKRILVIISCSLTLIEVRFAESFRNRQTYKFDFIDNFDIFAQNLINKFNLTKGDFSDSQI